MRFVVDDAPWAPADVSAEELDQSLDRFADRIDEILARHEGIQYYEDVYRLELVGSDTLDALVYDRDNRRQLSRDVRLRLSRAFDRIGSSFDEGGLSALEVDLDGGRHLAPSIVLAWEQTKRGHGVACVSPPSSGRSGPREVRVADEAATVHFVSDERGHVAFFRTLMVVEKADEDAFGRLAASAFPRLRFVEGVWRGLRDLSRPYRDRRDDVIHHLSVLNDHGERIFALKLAKRIESEFMALKLTISQETREALADQRCRRARERQFGGESLIFDWHTKIELHLDRIHVHPGTAKSAHQIIVGIIHRHLPLPGD